MHKLAQIIFDRKVKVRYSAFVALVAGAWHHGNPFCGDQYQNRPEHFAMKQEP